MLVALPLSLWAEKARWALDHHGVDYIERTTIPVLGAPRLRWKLRRLRDRTAVPILFDRRGTLCLDPLDIARYAERTGGGEPLFRRGDERAIAHWSRASDQAIDAARALSSARLAADPAAREEALVTVAPRRLASLLRPAAMLAARLLHRRHGGRAIDEHPDRARLRQVLDELRRALSDGRRFLVGGALSYCDIAMAAALHGVEPGDARHLPFGRAMRRTSTDLELAGEFPDLLGWRDQIYAEHRNARSGTPLLD
jgi:glutathione S-transferase